MNVRTCLKLFALSAVFTLVATFSLTNPVAAATPVPAHQVAASALHAAAPIPPVGCSETRQYVYYNQTFYGYDACIRCYRFGVAGIGNGLFRDFRCWMPGASELIVELWYTL